MAICNNKKCSIGECDQSETCAAYVPVITNADRIRSMTDEELCKFLGECKFCDICEEGCDNCTYNGDCNKRLLEWLQKPAEISSR